MPIDFQVGEIVQRLRDSLVIVGRAPLDIDERMNLSVNAFDLTEAPWRNSGSRFYVSENVPNSLGNFTTVAVGSGSSPGSGAVHVLDGLWITNNDATATGVNIGWPTFLIGPLPTRLARYPEKGNPFGASSAEITYGLGPAATFSQTPAAAPVGNTIADIALNVPPLSTVYVPLEITLQNPATGVVQYAVCTQVVNRSLAVSWTGRTFNVQPSPQ